MRKYVVTTTATVEFVQEIWATSEKEAEDLVIEDIKRDIFDMEREYNIDIELDPVESVVPLVLLDPDADVHCHPLTRSEPGDLGGIPYRVGD